MQFVLWNCFENDSMILCLKSHWLCLFYINKVSWQVVMCVQYDLCVQCDFFSSVYVISNKCSAGYIFFGLGFDFFFLGVRYSSSVSGAHRKKRLAEKLHFQAFNFQRKLIVTYRILLPTFTFRWQMSDTYSKPCLLKKVVFPFHLDFREKF